MSGIELGVGREDDGLVFVNEIVFSTDDDGFTYCSGRYSAFWSADTDARGVEPGPQGVLLDEALTWARSRAPVVVVFKGLERRPYSAGMTQLGTEQLPDMPAPLVASTSAAVAGAGQGADV